MKSYTQLLDLYQRFTQNTSAENQVMGKMLLNDSLRAISTVKDGKWHWLETVIPVSTVANQQAYPIYANVRKLIDAYTRVGNMTYTPALVESPEVWKRVIQGNLGTSNVAQYVYRQNRQILIAPTPANVQTLFVRARMNVPDIGIEDYSTGSVAVVANGGTAVTGTGVTWTTDMIGRYIRISAPTGDGYWYRIIGVPTSSILTLESPYQGFGITGSAPYVIGEMSPIPESFDIAPVYRAAAIYWSTQDQNRAVMWWRMYDGGREAGLLSKSAPYGGMIGQMIDENDEAFEGASMDRWPNAGWPKGTLWTEPDTISL